MVERGRIGLAVLGERVLRRVGLRLTVCEVSRASILVWWDVSSLNAWEEKQPLGAAVGVELGIGEFGIGEIRIGSSWWINPDLRRASGPASVLVP